ncbi:MAG TPA: diaminobutyrate--2-oxoglutarate transaminase [Burkholderiales bacterium]|nr:diaminobutyrate--2-oxoglutarate transaminase [Burkholderiales bacterium]
MSACDLQIFGRLESEVRGYVRSFPTLFDKAREAILIDQAGNQYIDFFAGAGTLNYGHNNPLLKRKLIDYVAADGLVHGLDMATVAKKRFIETFERLVLEPRGMRYKLQFTAPTGTNSVEAALKLARQVKGRSNVVAFTNGFHGVSGGSLAATGNSKFRDAAGFPLSNTTFMPYDGYLGSGIDTTEFLEQMVVDRSSGVDAPAAVIVETVQGEGGVNVASAEWLRALERVCRRHDMLLIVDDIQVGCGRTGTFFSFEEAGIRPDMVTLSKSISGYGLPMALTLIRPELDIWQPGAHSGTFRGHNLAFVTAAETLVRYWTTDEFARDVVKKGRSLRLWLEHIARDYSQGGFAVRGRGMIQGLVAAEPELAQKISERAFANGLIIETSGAQSEVLKCLPPLTIEEAQLQAGLKLLEQSVAEALGVPLAEPGKVQVLRAGGAR